VDRTEQLLGAAVDAAIELAVLTTIIWNLVVRPTRERTRHLAVAWSCAKVGFVRAAGAWHVRKQQHLWIVTNALRQHRTGLAPLSQPRPGVLTKIAASSLPRSYPTEAVTHSGLALSNREVAALHETD
jgi:hypothetical protein